MGSIWEGDGETLSDFRASLVADQYGDEGPEMLDVEGVR